MSDQTYEVFQHYGTAAERAAFTPDPEPSIQPIYIWYETDTGDVYIYDTSWHLVSSGAPSQVVSLRFTLDGGGEPLTAGVINKYIYVRNAMTLVGWSIQGPGVAGDAEFDVYNDDPDSTYPPTTSIVGTDPPELTGDEFARSANLTGWDTSIPADSMIGAELVSVDGTLEELVLQLDFTIP